MYISCQICKNKISLLLKIKKFPEFTINNQSKEYSRKKKNNLKIFFCNKCKNISSSKKINYKNLYSFHKSKNIKLKKKINYIKKEINKGVNLKTDDKVIEISKHKVLNEAYIREKKIKYHKIKINKFEKEFNNCKIENIKLIWCHDFIGNINNINKFFAQASKALTNDGTMICEHHYGPSLLKNLTLDRIYFEHINYFSITALDELSQKNKLYISNVYFQENKNFFTIHFKKKKSENFKYKLKKLINIEKKINFKNTKIFLKKLINIKKRLEKIIKSKNLKNYSIIGFGSSIAALPIILYFNLEKKIELLIDDYPLSKFFPLKNINIRIIETKKLNLQKKKIVICLAPRYFDFLKNKILKKLSSNDYLINLIPNFKVIKKT